MGMELVVSRPRVSRRRIGHPVQRELSADVIVKAQAIALEWGLKSPHDAVEAVFRKYADEYMYGRQQGVVSGGQEVSWSQKIVPEKNDAKQKFVQCEAMNELDGLLGL
jgi:hypothetical protein